MSDFLDTRKGESPASGATEDGAFGAKREGSDTQAEFSVAQAAPAIIDTAAAVSFLQWLRPEGPWLLATKHPERNGLRPKLFAPGQEADLAQWLAGLSSQNVYYHLNPTRDGLEKKAVKSDVTAVRFLHVDIDPRAGEDVGEERQRIIGRLTHNLPKELPPPTAIISSGAGAQALWALREPILLDGSEAQAAEAERYTRWIQGVFGEADNCHNVDRILRLPGSINNPDAKKRAKGRTVAPATVVELHPERVYGLESFQQAPAQGAAAPVAVRTPSAALAAVSLGEVEPLESVDSLDKWSVPGWLKVLIVQGNDPDNPTKYPSRSEALFAAACGLVRQGVPDEVIFSVLTDESFGIAESVVEHKNPEKYARRQIDKAHEAVGQDVGWNPTNKAGEPLKSLHNTITALRLIGLECSHDLFRRRNMVGHHQMQELSGEFSDMAEVLIRREIRCRFGFDPGKDHVRDAVLELCAADRFDPLLDYLHGLPTWDGVPRLDSWLVRYLGAEDSPYIRAAGATWLVAAMARAFEPGTKFDHMLVLVGAQGRGKSSALNILAGEFFSDANFLDAQDTREVLEATEGAWIVECAELAGMRRKDVETLKHEITRREDRGRPAYARTVVSVKRRFVLAGTTNSGRFLHDETGNRRFWPVEVGEIDLPGLQADRDQILAEALARYHSGDFQLFLTDEALEGAQLAQEARRTVEDGFLEIAEGLHPEGFYEGTAAIRTDTVYQSMGIPPERRRGQLATDVRRAMEEAGWKPSPGSVRWQGKKQRLYLWAKDEPPPPPVSAQPF